MERGDGSRDPSPRSSPSAAASTSRHRRFVEAQRAGGRVERGGETDGKRQHLLAVAEGETGHSGDAEAADVVGEDLFEAQAGAFDGAVGAIAEDDAGGAG